MSYTESITNPDGTINHSAPASLRPGDPKKGRKYKPHFCRFGIPDVPDKCVPSYSKITFKNVVTMMGVSHDLTIFDNAVWVDGMKVVNAPDNFTKARKEKFLRAVIWSMINDQENFFDQLNRCTDIRDGITEKPESEITPAIQYKTPAFPVNPYGYLKCIIQEVPA